MYVSLLEAKTHTLADPVAYPVASKLLGFELAALAMEPWAHCRPPLGTLGLSESSKRLQQAR